tara:strand:+ start:2157 stop:2939 length:783 start_codon:yes stop_codon:yes gene_type:complete
MYSNVVLSIGGSDSGGGAGIQADLRTFMALKVHGCTAITCITAQNSLSVNTVEAIEEDVIESQIETVFSDFKISCLKTGMLLNENIILRTSQKLIGYDIPKIIDPVMVSRAGSLLIDNSGIMAYKKILFPQADLITPNIFEAKLLSGIDIKDKKDIEIAGLKLLEFGPKAVLIKGGGINHLQGNDFYINRSGVNKWFKTSFIDTTNTHGSGCTLSAAICSYKGLGFNLIESIKKAKFFVRRSLARSYKIGSGPGPLGHFQ